MTAHERKRDPCGFRQFTRPVRPLPQQIHDAPAVRVRQRGESTVQVGGAHVNGLYLNPVACSISATVTVLTACEKVQ